MKIAMTTILKEVAIFQVTSREAAAVAEWESSSAGLHSMRFFQRQKTKTKTQKKTKKRTILMLTNTFEKEIQTIYDTGTSQKEVLSLHNPFSRIIYEFSHSISTQIFRDNPYHTIGVPIVGGYVF